MKRKIVLISLLLQLCIIPCFSAKGAGHYSDITGNTIQPPSVTAFCSVANPDIIFGSAPSGGADTYNYQWQSSADSITFINISGAVNINYDPPQLSLTTWYRRIVTSGTDPAISISNVVSIIVSQPVTNNIITAPSVTALTFAAVPGAITGNTPSGDNAYGYQWQLSTDNSIYSNIAGATGKDITNLPLITQTTYFCRIVTAGGCTVPVMSNKVKITVTIPVTGNTVMAPLITGFCSSGDADNIAGNLSAGGSGPITYQWQSSADSVNFTPVTGAGGTDFNPPPLSTTTYYRRLAFSGPPGAAFSGLAANNIDVFLIGGQSNALGKGDLAQQVPIPAGICWQYQDPVIIPVTTQAIGSDDRGSAWAAFAIAYYNKTGRKVLFVPTAVGGTGQVAYPDDRGMNWDTTGTLFNRSLTLLRKGIAAASTAGWTPVLRGILWDQGEKDATRIGAGEINIGQYQSHFQTMIANYRARLAIGNLPFYVFRIANGAPSGFQVQATQESVAGADSNMEVIYRDAVDYTMANGFLSADGVHYTEAGYNLMGQTAGTLVGGYAAPAISNIIKISIINLLPPVLANAAIIINSGTTGKLTIASPAPGVAYNWFDSPTGVTPLFTGTNYITNTLTADKTYYVQASSGSCGSSAMVAGRVIIDDGLTGLTLNSGSISPSFSQLVSSYTATVASTQTSVTLTPATNIAASKVSVNGVIVASGAASAAIPLVTGDNTITVIVTASDGSTKTFTIVVTRPSTIATLSALNISGGVLSPVFAPGTTAYTATVLYATSSVIVTSTTTNTAAKVKIAGVNTPSGTASAPIALSVGTNAIVSTVTAQDGITHKSYTITVTRAPASSNANLADLSISGSALSPVFSPGITSYSASVINTTAAVTVTPVTADATAIVMVNGKQVVSGTPSASISLNTGINTIITTVTAQDGLSTQTYTTIVTRTPSSNAALSSLSLSSGSLSPVFDGGTLTYLAAVDNDVTSVTALPVTADSTATVTVNGITVAQGSSSAAIPLNIGANTITSTVTAQDNITTQSYTIVITRAPSTNAVLSGLTLSTGELNPVFSSGVTDYNATISNITTAVFLTPFAVDSTAMIRINGAVVASGTSSAPILLNVGANVITVIVTAQDGVTLQSYHVTLTRAASANAGLSNLFLNSGAVNPKFATGVNNYTASVNNTVSFVNITPVVSDTTATVTVNGVSVFSGAPSADIPLIIGANVITTVVTAQDGVTLQTYTTTVTRLASSNADLASLVPSPGKLNPVFSADITDYVISVTNSVTSLTLMPASADYTATIKINGFTVISGTKSPAIPLIVGANVITVVVTAQDSITSKTYTLTATRAPSVNDDLANLRLSTGTLSPTFATATNNYTAAVSNATTTVTVKPTAVVAVSTMKVNGVVVAQGATSAAISLAVGPNIITTAVTAQDGVTSKTYTVNITRAASANDNLSGLKISSGTLSPVFTTGTTVYTASVNNSITAITLTPTTSVTLSTVKVNGISVVSGSASPSINLAVGKNTISTVVTAQDSTTTLTYKITITRAPSANDNLSSLKLSSGTLSPVFAATTTGYTASVSNGTMSVTIKPTTSVAVSTVKVNGVKILSGTVSSPINLGIGDNVITTVVTAQDSITRQTYTITLNRAGAVSNYVYVPIEPENSPEHPETPNDDVVVHQAVSPNGDGLNDVFLIDGIKNHPENTLKIMSKVGTLVFEANGYDNNTRVFDGHSSKTGKMQSPGTYFYSLDYKVKSETKHKTGFFVLKY